METKKEKIIKVYEKDLKHPSYGYIAKTVGCSKVYAFGVIKAYLASRTGDNSKTDTR